MTDILLLTTSASWRKLNHLCGIFAKTQGTDQDKAQYHAICYISIAPYSSEDGGAHLAELAKNDAITACSLSLYRASLLFAYKHIINKDLKRAHEECSQAIHYLLESLNRIGIYTDLKQHGLEARARCFVNSLSSQAELLEARAKNKIASHLVFILGMHRSGTSALTGMLAHAGFSAPIDPIQADESNPKGYWESLSINKLNEKFLMEMESHWSSSLPLPAGWSESISARKWRSALIRTIMDTYKESELPTLKDPRFCILITGLEPWLESGLVKASFIIPIRHPLEVCNSLQQAHGTNLNTALRLWIKSIFVAEKATQSHRRSFISFDVLIQNPINALVTCLKLVESSLALEDTASSTHCQSTAPHESLRKASSFIDKGLRRQKVVIIDKGLPVIHNDSNKRLIDLAEKTYHAIINNTEDDQRISTALDELRPCILGP